MQYLSPPKITSTNLEMTWLANSLNSPTRVSSSLADKVSSSSATCLLELKKEINMNMKN